MSNFSTRWKAAEYVLIVLLVLILVPGCTTAPENAKSFKSIFDHYRDKENMVAISFPPGLIGIFLSENDPEQAEIKKLMQDLSAFRMLSLDIGSADEGGSENEELASELSEAVTGFTTRNEFQDLFRMQSGGEDIFIRIQEKEGIVREAIMMMNSGDSFFVIELRGNISIDHFTRLVEGGQLQNLTDLADIDF